MNDGVPIFINKVTRLNVVTNGITLSPAFKFIRIKLVSGRWEFMSAWPKCQRKKGELF